MRMRNLLAPTLLLALAGHASAGTATLEFIGDGIAVTDISEDGSVLVGNVLFDDSYETWRWDARSGEAWQSLGRGTVLPLGIGGGSPDVSYDGTRVSAAIIDETLSFMTPGVWTEGGGWFEVFPPLVPNGVLLDGSYGSAWGLSGDGLTLTGLCWTNRGKPFAWTQAGGPIVLDVDPARSGRANAANLDGSVVAGWEEVPTGPWRPTAWRNGVKHTLTDTPILCMAEAVSADGSVIVGNTYNLQADRRNAARWDWNGSTYVLTDLGVLPGTPQTFIARVFATGVTDDGSMIVGTNRFQDNGPFSVETGFVWTAEDGMRDIVDVVGDYGLSFPEGFQVSGLVVSPDGSAIAGFGLDTTITGVFAYRTFIFRYTPLPACHDLNGDNVIDTADLGLLVGAFGKTGANLPADLNGDGVIDTADLGLMIQAFGQTCD